jgi:hypothetical protein
MNRTTISQCWLCKAEGVVTYPVIDRDVCVECLDLVAPGALEKALQGGYKPPRHERYGKTNMKEDKG